MWLLGSCRVGSLHSCTRTQTQNRPAQRPCVRTHARSGCGMGILGQAGLRQQFNMPLALVRAHTITHTHIYRMCVCDSVRAHRIHLVVTHGTQRVWSEHLGLSGTEAAQVGASLAMPLVLTHTHKRQPTPPRAHRVHTHVHTQRVWSEHLGLCGTEAPQEDPSLAMPLALAHMHAHTSANMIRILPFVWLHTHAAGVE